jgi:tellurite resistance protein TehA-like permease
MPMANYKLFLVAVAVGTLVTATTLAYNQTPWEFSSMVWSVGFIANLVLWSAIAGLAIFAAERYENRTAKRARKRR